MNNKEKLKIISKIILAIAAPLVIFYFPLFLESKVANNNIQTNYDGKEWFSFWGSYIGTIVTIIVMYFTIILENRKYRNALKRQYESYKIEKDIELIKRIVNVLLLNNYDILDRKKIFFYFLRDVHDIEFEIITLLGRDNISKNQGILLEKLLELQMEEMKIAYSQGDNIVSVINGNDRNAKKKANELIQNSVSQLLSISNQYRSEVKTLYESYIEDMKEKEFKD